jgi:hypothetical protein
LELNSTRYASESHTVTHLAEERREKGYNEINENDFGTKVSKQTVRAISL